MSHGDVHYIAVWGGGVRLYLGCHDTSGYFFNSREQQKVDSQEYISLESSFHKLFKNTIVGHPRGIDETLS